MITIIFCGIILNCYKWNKKVETYDFKSLFDSSYKNFLICISLHQGIDHISVHVIKILVIKKKTVINIV